MPDTKRFLKQLPYLGRTVRLVWSAAPRWTLAWAVLFVVQGLLPLAIVYLSRQLVDALVALVGSGLALAAAAELLWPAALLAAATVAQQSLSMVAAWVRTGQAEHVRDAVSDLVQRQAIKLDLAFFEHPDEQDLLYRARLEANHRVLALLENLGALAQQVITLLAMAAVLFAFGWWLPLLLLIGAAPAFVVLFHHSRLERAWREQTTESQRLAMYYDWLLTAPDAAAELRLFALGDRFRALFQEIRGMLRQGRIALARKRMAASLAAAVLGLLAPALALLRILWQALQGALSLGDLTLLYQAFNQGQGVIRTLLQNMTQLYSNMLFLSDLWAFLALTSMQGETGAAPTIHPLPLRQGIAFCGVRFAYPGSEAEALTGLDLNVVAGQTVAIVGANGAGKSTLIKLLCRLYDPDQGVIQWDGIDLRQMDGDALRRQVSVMAQDPVRYYGTVAQNISWTSHWPAEREAFQAAARAAGAVEMIARLPKGFETRLGRLFSGGTELSGGQWQRLALARAAIREASVVVLDEPTSTMDSWSEARWFERFDALAEGRTVIIITHRFTTAMRADLIYVMDGGQVVESGSHEELLALNGRYATSWRTQMRAVDRS